MTLTNGTSANDVLIGATELLAQRLTDRLSDYPYNTVTPHNRTADEVMADQLRMIADGYVALGKLRRALTH